ncbi:hypothetical protein VTO42DRAFT_4869 [Malbranchea cinnamomea]
MKSAFLLTAAAGLLGSALANQGFHRRHGHDAFHRRGVPAPDPAPTCGCTTKVITEYGEATIVPEPVTESTTTIHSTSWTTVTVSVTPSTPSVELPTPIVTVFPTPGTYTIPPATITVTSETTVCGATSTHVGPGEHTYGGVTTVVETATTVVCPVATAEPDGSTSTSYIFTTTFVCPTPGTYTIAPSTTSVSQSTVFVYPTPIEFPPGTYTRPGETVTVVETDYVYVCPTATTAPAPPPAENTSQPAPPPPAPKPSNGPSVPPIGGGDKWGMTFSPYTQDGQCMGQDEVNRGIAKIKKANFGTVRVYAPDCNALETVGSAVENNGLKLVIGVFISGSGVDVAKEQIQQIIDWGKFGLVEMIVVGNEAIFSGSADAPTLARFIEYATQQFRGAGYNGPITTTEPLNIWEQHGNVLCPVVDVVGANIHPFFNPEVSAQECGSFAKSQMEILGKICGGKEVYNLETGWPSAGNPNGKAVPGVEEQAIAIASLVEEVGSKSIFFSFQDDLWKNPGPFNVEQSWGCIQAFTS